MQWISPRNHMVFTPLLASTAVGTLEFRSVALPVREIQSALAWPQNNYICASATSINPNKKQVECESQDGVRFAVDYDQLVIATGAAGSTFNIPGVEQHTHFLRDVSHASAIRSKIIENLSLANTPGAAPSNADAIAMSSALLSRRTVTHTLHVTLCTDMNWQFLSVRGPCCSSAGGCPRLALKVRWRLTSRGQPCVYWCAGRSLQQRNTLLHVVIVGGGPTGVEVAGEIVDFVDSDMKRLYPDMARDARGAQQGPNRSCLVCCTLVHF